MQAGIGQNRLIVTNWSEVDRYNRIKPENPNLARATGRAKSW
jgi:hypothetical protein